MEGFLEVARRGNVSRAAEAMFVTQPTLTARLHALERELGEPLFARTRRGMKLTDAGRAFLPYAERAMRAVRDGRQALADARSASAGRLVLGAAPAVSTYVLPALLQRFAGAFAAALGSFSSSSGASFMASTLWQGRVVEEGFEYPHDACHAE